MLEEELLDLLESDATAARKFTLLGKAIKRGELDWVERESQESVHEAIYIKYISRGERPVCRFCGGRVSFIGFTRGFKEFCSVSHARSYVQKVKGDEIRKKSKATLKEKYGVDHPFQLETSKESHRRAMLSHRGKPLSSDHVDAIKKGVLEKYGVENVSQVPNVRDKVTSTMSERYGGYYIGSKEAREARYERWIQRRLSRLDVIDKIQLLEPYTGSKRPYRAVCLECKSEFETLLSNGFVRKCPRCYFVPANRSLKEGEISKEINALGLTVITNAKNKDLIYPYELDIWIPEKRTAIEFNGDYYHSDRFKDNKYHVEKLEACSKKGIRLIQVFEHEYDYKKEIVLGRIRSVLGMNRQIGARKLTVDRIDSKSERKFFDENHLQGYVPSSTCVALIDRGEIVAAMSFGKPRFARTFDVELLRFASKTGLTVQGGAGKLLSAAKKTMSNSSMISYCDRRWSVGGLYEKLGFMLMRTTRPGYVYVNRSTQQIVSRYAAQKKNLRSLLGVRYDESLTERENMEKNRFLKLWDCGQLVYSLQI